MWQWKIFCWIFCFESKVIFSDILIFSNILISWLPKCHYKTVKFSCHKIFMLQNFDAPKISCRKIFMQSSNLNQTNKTIKTYISIVYFCRIFITYTTMKLINIATCIILVHFTFMTLVETRSGKKILFKI